MQRIYYDPEFDDIDAWTNGTGVIDDSPYLRQSSSYAPTSGTYGAFVKLGFDSSKCTRSGTVTRGKQKSVKYIIKVL